MMSLEIDGIAHDLHHLQQLAVVATGKGKDGADLRIAVHLGLHTVSRACSDGELPNMQDENGKPRIFCEDRYAFSLGLPEIARRMVEQNYFCWESSDRNRAINYAVVDVAPGRIRDPQPGQHQVIFFYLYPGDGVVADVHLHITSCHLRHVNFAGIKRRFNLHVLLRKCLYAQKRIP